MWFQVRIHGTNGDVVVTSIVVPKYLPTPIWQSSEKVKFAKDRYQHLATSELADDQDEGTVDHEISMLIGEDFYWSIIMDEIHRDSPVVAAG